MGSGGFYGGDHRPFHERLDLQLLKVDGLTDILSGRCLLPRGRDLVYPCLAYLARIETGGLGALDTWFGILSGFCAGAIFHDFIWQLRDLYQRGNRVVKDILESQRGLISAAPFGANSTFAKPCHR